jgi:RNA-directed DNA polymerase
MRAVAKHTDCKWIILYISRWLISPFQTAEGERIERKAGTPQGGIISPVLANLFLHYAFDKWIEKNNPQNPWARYADDGIIHCKTREEAERLLSKLQQRFEECGLALHPEKTKIIYCKDDNRTGEHQEITFDFLGYTYRPRSARTKTGERFLSFLPAVGNKASKGMRQSMRQWKMYWKTSEELAEIAMKVNPVVRGWMNYYGRFYKSAMYPILRQLNWKLSSWVARKYKRVKGRQKLAKNWLAKMAECAPKLFVHWQMGMIPTVR